ncbi:MAG: hypothetical protein JNM76_15195 [Betaproteobacteria bacterium]|nr:hypothetical protein [Betaproteobacteria bacterium]
MNILRRPLQCFSVLALLLLHASLGFASQANERDRQVLEALFSHMLRDPKFSFTEPTSKQPQIVLHTRTPIGTVFLSPNQISADSGRRTLSEELVAALRRRNTPDKLGSDPYESVGASYGGLSFSSNIVVSDVTHVRKQQLEFSAFKKAYPRARGWLEVFLPGYSRDGDRAMVRAFAGPSPHGAVLTAELRNLDGRWFVDWHHLAFLL